MKGGLLVPFSFMEWPLLLWYLAWMTNAEELPEREEKKPQKHYYEYSPEDVIEMLERLKRDAQLVNESDVYKRVGTASFDMEDIVKIADHYIGRIVIESFKTGQLKWHEPIAVPGTIWPKLLEK